MGRKEQLKYIDELMSQPEILELAREVRDGEREIEVLLQELYRQGFSEVPVLEDAEKLFSEYVLTAQRIFSEELASYRKDKKGWIANELQEAEDPDQYVCALGLLAAELHGTESQKVMARQFFSGDIDDGNGIERAFSGVAQSLAAAQMVSLAANPFIGTELMVKRVFDTVSGVLEKGHAEWKASVGVVQILSGMGMAALFPGGWAAALPQESVERVSAIVTMISYIAIKREYLPGIHPEVSFGAVCVLSLGLTGVLCGGEDAQDAAFVSAALAVRWMCVQTWSVMSGCVQSLPKLSAQVIGELLKPAIQTVAPGCAIRWKRMPEPKKDFQPLALLMKPRISKEELQQEVLQGLLNKQQKAKAEREKKQKMKRSWNDPGAK
ncbi:MAG: hypothetical protein IKY96_07530 [Oscillospiraceae bacterium]|nr:hypothetical protein [Oscillospiraceae bacterium]